ncbi:MAG: hypothetical protein ACRD6U_08305 [Nitrososphaeraceae archaeon]
MSKKKKTPLSEIARKMCTEPARKAKNAAIENNRPNDARIAALNETNCRIIEESFKQDKQKKNLCRSKS